MIWSHLIAVEFNFASQTIKVVSVYKNVRGQPWSRG